MGTGGRRSCHTAPLPHYQELVRGARRWLLSFEILGERSRMPKKIAKTIVACRGKSNYSAQGRRSMRVVLSLQKSSSGIQTRLNQEPTMKASSGWVFGSNEWISLEVNKRDTLMVGGRRRRWTMTWGGGSKRLAHPPKHRELLRHCYKRLTEICTRDAAYKVRLKACASLHCRSAPLSRSL